ncbi:MAG: DUF4403 family protein [Bacteroidota bacterium]
MAKKESAVYLALRFDVDQLEKLIDLRLSESLQQVGRSPKDKRMHVELQKHGSVHLKFAQDRIISRIPLRAALAYDLGLTKVEGSGKINLEFETTYHIQPDWQLKTNTDLITHQWVDRPRIQVAALDVPISGLIDFLIEETEKRVEETIDQLANKQLDLQNQIFTIWRKLHSPLPLDKQKTVIAVVKPTCLSLSRLIESNGVLKSTILLKGEPEIHLGQSNEKYDIKSLTAFGYKDLDYTQSNVEIDIHLPFNRLEVIAHNNLIGKPLKLGDRQIHIEDVKLNQINGLLHIYLKSAGSFDGEVYIKGRLNIDQDRNRIRIEQLDVDVNTKNILHKAAAWMFANKIKNKIHEGLNEQLSQALLKTKDKLQADLNGLRILEGIELRTQIDSLELIELDTLEDKILATTNITAKLAVMTTAKKSKPE